MAPEIFADMDSDPFALNFSKYLTESGIAHREGIRGTLDEAGI